MSVFHECMYECETIHILQLLRKHHCPVHHLSKVNPVPEEGHSLGMSAVTNYQETFNKLPHLTARRGMKVPLTVSQFDIKLPKKLGMETEHGASYKPTQLPCKTKVSYSMSISHLYNYHSSGDMSILYLYNCHSSGDMSIRHLYNCHSSGDMSIRHLYNCHSSGDMSIRHLCNCHSSGDTSILHLYNCHSGGDTSIRHLYNCHSSGDTSILRHI